MGSGQHFGQIQTLDKAYVHQILKTYNIYESIQKNKLWDLDNNLDRSKTIDVILHTSTFKHIKLTFLNSYKVKKM